MLIAGPARSETPARGICLYGWRIIYNGNNSPADSFFCFDRERAREGVPQLLLRHARHIDFLFQFGPARLIPAIPDGDGAGFGDRVGFVVMERSHGPFRLAESG